MAGVNDIERLREVMLGFAEVTEETPFGPEVLVYKVAGKIGKMDCRGRDQWLTIFWSEAEGKSRAREPASGIKLERWEVGGLWKVGGVGRFLTADFADFRGCDVRGMRGGRPLVWVVVRFSVAGFEQEGAESAEGER